MIAHKHISKIVAVIMAIAVCLCLCAMAFTDQLVTAVGGTSVTMEYESKLFDTSEPLNVNIIMDDSEWTDMLANATSEQYYQCDVEINGKMYYRVGIRPKGNTSLSNIASDPDTDRFSFKLEFDQYVDGQTCYGLDKLILNNNYADATNMKEALIYDMFQYLDVDSALTNYAKISVNDEYCGVYLALEAVEDSFLLRNYGTADGELYKPDSMEIGGGGGNMTQMPNMGEKPDIAKMPNMGERPDMATMPNMGEIPDMSQMPNMGERPDMATMPNMGEIPDMSQMPNTGERPDMAQMPNMGEKPDNGNSAFSDKTIMSGKGADLNYTDDNLDSYSTIWEGEITKTSTKDHQRVVEALKNISQGTKLEEYMDIDNLLKYMAVHVFSVNADSLSGSMAHNYYLYESNGMLNLLPWDYNLALGGMGGMDRSGSTNRATSIVNDAIDNAFASTDFFDTLMENEEYKAKYYSYLQQLVNEYLLGDGFENFYTKTRNQIDSLVETDPTAFYTYEQYTTAVETLYEIVKLRGQSILGQLNGTIPSTESEQTNSDALIDASNLDISIMGSMNMGGGQGKGFSSGDRSNTLQEVTSIVINTTTSSKDTGNDMETQQSNGQMPEEMNPSQAGSEMPEGMGPPLSNNTTQSNGTDEQMQNRFDMSKLPNMNTNGNGVSSMQTIIIYGICFAVLIVALIFVKLYRRKPRKR